ncbi:MAG TPA: aminoglycoside adenylyltransferase domain-containing protein [Anaerolineales bacterium]|nr:aminoglycoside adenylyltransferase domain-containing protein [Anaerolineales bacterium]
MKLISPTPYPDVNEILNLLFTNVKEILKDQFVGMYLHGSLANGGFDRGSDIDVIFVTQEDISEELFSALHAMHLNIAKLDSPWAMQMEVSYIPIEALRRFDPTNILHPHIDRGNGEVLHRMHHESDWMIQRHILRERGIVISGPDPKTLIDPVSPNDMRQAVLDGIPLWFNPILEDPSEINKRGYQSFFVLSLCRMLYTLKHGEILSKQAAAEWAKANLEARWTPLIDRALIGRLNPDLDAEAEDIKGTLEMMRYTIGQIKPTPYAEVNEVLNLLLANVQEILKEQFVGMYLYGSLSSGDFNLETSDIDFLVITEGVLLEKRVAELEVMHNRTWATSLKRAGKLEGAYVSRELIRRHDPNGAPCPTINEGQYYVAPLGSDWIIQRYVVREMGVSVEGPDPKTLIDPVTPDDIRRSILGILDEWWFPMLEDPSWLRDHDSAYRSFAVISMCRVLHALETGTIVSKPSATRWAQTKLDEPWKQLVDKAVAVSNHEDLDIPLEETLDFIRFTREQVMKFTH